MKYGSILTALAVFAAVQLKAQTCYYVTVESGQNYALQTNQIVTIVGLPSGFNTGPSVGASLADGLGVTMTPGNSFTGLTNVYVGQAYLGGWNQTAVTFQIKTQPCNNPNTLPVIPSRSRRSASGAILVRSRQRAVDNAIQSNNYKHNRNESIFQVYAVSTIVCHLNRKNRC